MRGCDRCGHRKRDHEIGLTIRVIGCVVIVGSRRCACPKYLKPETMR